MGGLIAGALTSLGGTKLAFTSAGTIAILVAALGAGALVRTAPPRRVEPRSP